jgi:Spy/CpxP family protein refolding chaperone
MDIFTRHQFLLRLAVFLLCLNLAATEFLLYQKRNTNYPKNKRSIEEVTSLLKVKLNLSDQQVSQLNRLRQDFFIQEEKLSSIIRSERDSMNEMMFNAITDSTKVIQIARRVADNEYRMELSRLNQAQQLKSICNLEQLKKFQDLVKDIRDYLQPINK